MVGRKKIYLSGPVSNDPDYRAKFKRAEWRLEDEGYAVINPATKGDGFTYKDYMDMDLCELMRCDAIYMLPGWEDSKGARLELMYATTVGLEVIEE